MKQLTDIQGRLNVTGEELAPRFRPFSRFYMARQAWI
jgi:hypothetical protein